MYAGFLGEGDTDRKGITTGKEESRPGQRSERAIVKMLLLFLPFVSRTTIRLLVARITTL